MKNIAIAVVLLVILGGIWMLGTTEKDSNWSTGQVRKNVSQFVENEKRSNSALQQTININTNSSEVGKNVDGSFKGLSGLPKKTAEQMKQQPKDKLRQTADPNDPDPSRSWTTEAKTSRPVEYMNQVLAYLKKRRMELRNMRFEVGTTLQEWELKKKEDLPECQRLRSYPAESGCGLSKSRSGKFMAGGFRLSRLHQRRNADQVV